MKNKDYKSLKKALLDQRKLVRTSKAEAEKLLVSLGLLKASATPPEKPVASAK